MGFLSSFVGDITGGLIGESSAEKAAKGAKKASSAATSQALGYVDDSWDYLDKTLTPYADYGPRAMQDVWRSWEWMPPPKRLQQFEFGAEDLQDDPSYQFRLNQGLQAVDRAAAKNRGLTSGNRGIALNDYAQNMASTEYQNAWQRALGANQANNLTLGNQYQMNMDRYMKDIGRNQWLANMGFGADQKLGDYRYRTGVDKGNLAIGHAANTTAADTFQAQTKSDFVGDLMGFAGTMWGGK